MSQTTEVDCKYMYEVNMRLNNTVVVRESLSVSAYMRPSHPVAMFKYLECSVHVFCNLSTERLMECSQLRKAILRVDESLSIS